MQSFCQQNLDRFSLFLFLNCHLLTVNYSSSLRGGKAVSPRRESGLIAEVNSFLRGGNEVCCLHFCEDLRVVIQRFSFSALKKHTRPLISRIVGKMQTGEYKNERCASFFVENLSLESRVVVDRC